ncbi:DUF4355 domain-containing protein [uncultured Ruminococcus sp.]|uniref:DUF4355 domain-containing protein n=1 Tax=uncultured Ruminococcus sp. TaxID=165186 RepID=UPI00261AA366|nr:DUF4355 domain-containing protein [uncultured Ruminococcus sp.]
MAEEFKPIETQEAFDNAIKARLDRNTESVKKQFEGFISPDDFKTKTADLNGKITDLTGKLAEKDTTIADLTAKNKAYETNSVKMRIAHESGIPYELAGKLSGETEEDIKKDAETLAKFIGKKQPAPLGSTEHDHADSKNAAYKSLLAGLTK